MFLACFFSVVVLGVSIAELIVAVSVVPTPATFTSHLHRELVQKEYECGTQQSARATCSVRVLICQMFKEKGNSSSHLPATNRSELVRGVGSFSVPNAISPSSLRLHPPSSILSHPPLPYRQFFSSSLSSSSIAFTFPSSLKHCSQHC